MTRRIAILDYGMGNLRSVEKALEHVGVTATITSDHGEARAADGLILPGVGAFPRAMERVRELGLDELIAERREAGVPILGICLGLQLLFDSTTELGGADGPGAARRARSPSSRPTGLKVPHIGWSPVRWERDSRLAEGIESETPFYFVHSFAPRRPPPELLGSAAYGARFACAAERDNVFGVQFHPEKSSAAGLRLLSNFAGVCAGARPGVILYPAIDIRGGQAVRLLQGDYERETDLRRRPGRRRDPLGRRRGRVPARRRPRRRQGGRAAEPRGGRRIAAAVECPIQVGGGLREMASVDAVLAPGAERVVIGTAALRDPEFLDGGAGRARRPRRGLGRRPRRQSRTCMAGPRRVRRTWSTPSPS